MFVFALLVYIIAVFLLLHLHIIHYKANYFGQRLPLNHIFAKVEKINAMFTGILSLLVKIAR